MKGVIKIAKVCMEVNIIQNTIIDNFPGFKQLPSNNENIILFEVEHPDIEMYCVHEVVLSDDYKEIICLRPEISHSAEPELIDY